MPPISEDYGFYYLEITASLSRDYSFYYLEIIIFFFFKTTKTRGHGFSGTANQAYP